ncbi:MAG: IclR family transcriptional regulator [Acidaminococcus sp.]|jgi:DNA-binding IclR family transcriptional regulator|nr:IclR family transcriptional regulator [Acidaminococcus sp.]MCI2100420.1 IclR family transcriptional regulator [Acidaminococcus sp.]MCI2114741.1 IclR family transcriptional regulator [Acidaminococcus sp.]MCI2116781.1 IclR family transcriptional regulator [Acidaminococcus sp.]
MKSPVFKPIQSVQRAIDIIDCFESARPALTLAEISKKTGLNINTTRGLVNTLLANHLLVRDPETLSYSLGMYFLGKSELIRSTVDSYIVLFKPIVDSIAEKYHFASSLQLVNQGQIYSVYCSYPTSRAYYIVLSEFSSLPKHATSSGKLLLLDEYKRIGESCLNDIEFKPYTTNSILSKEELLKQLKEIDKVGYATELEEYTYGVASVAVPIYDKDDHLLLTISATFFTKYMEQVRESLTSELKSVVAQWRKNEKKGVK